MGFNSDSMLIHENISYNFSPIASAVLYPEEGNSTTELYDTNEEVISVVVPTLFAVIFIIGLIGNGCVIGAVLRYKAMRSAPNMFIVNLAAGDVLLLIISVPTSGLLYTLDSWPFGVAICKLSYFIKTLSLGVSIFTLTALSIDRALVIAHTMKTFKEKGSQRITIMVIAVWVSSIIIALPDAISYHLASYDTNGTTMIVCSPHPKSWYTFDYPKIHATLHFAIFFAIPLLIIAVCYGLMAHIMVGSARSLPGESTSSSAWRVRQIRTRRRVANIVIVLIILFAICWLPRNIWIMSSFYSEKRYMTPMVYYFRILTYCLTFLNSCVNPIALYFLSKSFKDHYRKQLCSCKATGNSVDTRQSQPDNAMTKLTLAPDNSTNRSDTHFASNSGSKNCECFALIDEPTI